MQSLRTLGRFGRDDSGQLSIEAAIMVPLLFWIYVATFTWFNSFRADATNVKAAYAVGDMLSRETQPVDADYIEGLNRVFSYMVLAEQPTWIRVSNVRYDAASQKLVLVWSQATGGHEKATIEMLRDRIPDMTPGDTVIVVETNMPYTPKFNVGLKPMIFHNVVVTRPRFAPQLCFQSCQVGV